MRSLLAWWYTISLPTQEEPALTPDEREKLRYARLTSTFTLLLLVVNLVIAPFGIFASHSIFGPITEITGLSCIIIAIICSKLGFQLLAASLVIASTIITTTTTFFTYPLDPSLLPIFSAFVVPVILAGSLMPPIAGLITAFLMTMFILLITFTQPHTAAYDNMSKLVPAAVTVLLPIIILIIVGVVTYAIVNNLIKAIRRADRAEEIIALQKELAQYEEKRAQEHQQLEASINLITQVHTAIANGDLNARIPANAGNVLWQVVGPLNNLLNRLQRWKTNSDQFERTEIVLNTVTNEVRRARFQQTRPNLPRQTGTPVDPLIQEISHLSEQSSRQAPFPSQQ